MFSYMTKKKLSSPLQDMVTYMVGDLTSYDSTHKWHYMSTKEFTKGAIYPGDQCNGAVMMSSYIMHKHVIYML